MYNVVKHTHGNFLTAPARGFVLVNVFSSSGFFSYVCLSKLCVCVQSITLGGDENIVQVFRIELCNNMANSNLTLAGRPFRNFNAHWALPSAHPPSHINEWNKWGGVL